MATLGDALSALTRQIRLDKLEPLLGTGKAPPAATPSSALTQTPVGANVSGNGVETKQLATEQRTVSPEAGKPAARAATSVSSTAASAYTRLSADATLITQLLADTPEAQSKPAVAMTGIDVSAALPEQVAKAFARSLITSGVFYESHLQEWVAGDRPLEALRAEPHNRLPLEFARSAALSNTAGAEERNATSTVTSTGTQSGAGANPAALPEALATIVREQLDTLDFRRVQWQGEVWPQQDAQLEIAEDQARREYESETAQAWRTTLRIDLPHLGQVEVRIALDPAGIGVSVQAAHDAVAALQPGRAIFTTALREAGIALRTVEVKANG
jgi:hypothetical protein